MADDLDRPGAEEWVPEDADIDELRRAAPDCRGCELWRDATQVVFSKGRQGAPLMLVGEQPGDREDLEGEPFVGPAGRLLADAVDAAGIGRDRVYVTRIGEVRGRVLPPDAAAGASALPAPVLVTTHPSALLRIADAADRKAAFEALVDDLRTAADAAD